MLNKLLSDINLIYNFEEYIDRLKNRIDNLNFIPKNEEEANHQANRKLNFYRINRMLKTYIPSEEIVTLINKIQKPQTWLVISEDWCGDSAQNLAVFYLLSKLNSNIDLIIIDRDENDNIMNLYLTNGTRSIPKVIGFNKEGNELFQWGPRPLEGQKIVDNSRKEGIEKSKYLEMLHLWYAKNKGKALEDELVKIFSHLINKNLKINVSNN